MGIRKLLGLALLAALLALPLAAGAQGDSGVVITDRYILREGEQVAGDLVVMARTIILQHGSRVAGNAALLGETVTAQGVVEGDLAILGDRVTLADGMQAGGDVTLCGGRIVRDTRVQIAGEYNASCSRVGDLLRGVAPLAFDPSHWEWEQLEPSDWHWERFDFLPAIQPPQVSPVERLAANVGWSLAMGAVAALVALVAPVRLRRMSDAALTSPVTTGLVGLLSLVVAAAVSVLVILSLVLVVTLCLVPLLGLAWLGLALLIVVGWAALSLPVGAWFLALINVQRVSAVAAATVGAILLAFATGLLTMSNWTLLLYAAIGLVLTGWGLGAVVLTRLGGQAYPNPLPARRGAHRGESLAGR